MSGDQIQYLHRELFYDICTFLAGNTASDSNYQVWIFSFQMFYSPKVRKTFSSAFSRTEQVLNRIMSASSGELVSETVFDSASRSDIFPESYSFI